MIRKYKNLIPKVPASCFIFPTAEIIGSVELGEDVIVYPGTVVRAGYGKITIGNKTNLQENVTFHVETGYDIHIGAGVTIGHNAIIHGCTIHDNVLVGMGAMHSRGRSSRGELLHRRRRNRQTRYAHPQGAHGVWHPLSHRPPHHAGGI